MKLVFAEQAWEDYLHGQASDRKLRQRIHALIKEASQTPLEGSGKPEPLRHALSGFWSRRSNEEHRMVDKVDGDSLLIAQLRYHYEVAPASVSPAPAVEGWGATGAQQSTDHPDVVSSLDLTLGFISIQAQMGKIILSSTPRRSDSPSPFRSSSIIISQSRSEVACWFA